MTFVRFTYSTKVGKLKKSLINMITPGKNVSDITILLRKSSISLKKTFTKKFKLLHMTKKASKKS